MNPSAAAPGWDRLEILFERAARLPPEKRGPFIARMRTEDPETARELESLLEASRPAAGFFRSLEGALFAGSEEGVEASLARIDPLYGTTVGHHRIDRRVGRGGMGVVYRAIEEETGEARALKFLPAHAAASREVRRRFMAEARATADIRHPNVGEILDVFETPDGLPYLVMPFYEGQTLRARLETGRLAPEEAFDWARQACEGLAAIHARDIVHRDLTPGNLFRTTEGVVKLLDFGLAKIADATLGTGSRPLGTMAYMSPEQLAGAPIDGRADIWSLGVVLYEMLTGERPYTGRTVSEVRLAILDDGRPGPPVDDLPPAAADLLTRMLARDPSARPPAAEILASGPLAPPEPRGWE